MYKVTSRSLRQAPAKLIRRFSLDVRPSLEAVDGALKSNTQHKSLTRWNVSSIRHYQPVSNSDFLTGPHMGVSSRNITSLSLIGTHKVLNKKQFSLKLRPERSYSSSADLPAHQEIGMPSLSPTMTEGNIAKWLKKEGDKVSPGEVLCEVETDKATVEMECMEEGYIAKIVKGDGAQGIQVGEVSMLIFRFGHIKSSGQTCFNALKSHYSINPCRCLSIFPSLSAPSSSFPSSYALDGRPASFGYHPWTSFLGHPWRRCFSSSTSVPLSPHHFLLAETWLKGFDLVSKVPLSHWTGTYDQFTLHGFWADPEPSKSFFPTFKPVAF